MSICHLRPVALDHFRAKDRVVRGEGRIFRRGPIWWVAYYRRGREYRESSRSVDQETARALLQKRLSTPIADSLTIRDLSRSHIVEQLPERDLRKLYADCLVTLTLLRARLSQDSAAKAGGQHKKEKPI